MYIYVCSCVKECIGMCVKKDKDPEDKEEYLGIFLEVDINFLRVDVDGRYYNRRGNTHINRNKNDSIRQRLERR